MSKRKSTSQTSQSSSSVATPTNPDWVGFTAQSLNTGIQKLGGVDPTSLVAPISDLERSAALGAGRLGQGAAGVGGDQWFADLLSGPAPSAGSASLLDNLSAYTNPYREQVVDAAMSDFDADAGRTRASQALALAGDGVFGGSGAAIARSLTEAELARARNSQISKLMSDMYATSATLASQDADRRQQAALANAQLALQDRNSRAQFALDRDEASRANVAAQAALGAQIRGVEQSLRSAPATQLSSLIEMFSGLPLQLFQGQSTSSTGTSSTKSTDTPSVLDTIGQLVDIGGSAMALQQSWNKPKSAG